MSSSTPRPGFFGTSHQAADDLQRLLRQALAVLPDPVRVDRGDAARRGGADVREHRQRDVEVVVRVRAPGQAPVAAGLRDAHRAGHGPEVRIGERNVDRLQRQRVHHLAPVGGDHVGRRRQAGGAAELGHHLAARRSRPRRRTDLRHRRPRRACRASGGSRPSAASRRSGRA